MALVQAASTLSRLPAALVAATMLAAPMGTQAVGESLMSPEIAVSCKPRAGVSADQAALICDEMLAALRSTYPDRQFSDGGNAAPQMNLRVTRANDKGVGLDLVWVSASGQETPGKPLDLTAYDRAVNATMRAGFYRNFLGLNPLPF
ncbi:MAG: hypothetical protein WBP18_01705 [Paracoccaceae bacterium]